MPSPPRSQPFFLCAFRKNKGPSEVDDAEDKCENTIAIENGISCDSLDVKGWHINDTFMTEDERLTPLWGAAVLLPKKLDTCFGAAFEHHKLSRADYVFFSPFFFCNKFWTYAKVKGNHTHEDHWSPKLLSTPSILKQFPDNAVRKCSHLVFVITDLKTHQYLSTSKKKVRPQYIFHTLKT